MNLNALKTAKNGLILNTIGILLATSLGLTGCADNSAQVANLTTENSQLKQQVQQLQEKLKETQSTTVEPATVVPASHTEVVATDPSAATYADIAGVFGEKSVKDLAKIGVLDASTGSFNPNQPITRGEFVAWLVKTNNLICPAERQIRLASASTSPSFKDLTPDNPYYNYIQGMADAGWSVGYPDKTFKPTKVLSREEMIAIKTPLDHGGKGYDGYETHWNDGDKIQETFRPAMSDEYFGKPNWTRIFGDTKSCNPQKAISRAEAAVCVSQIGWHSNDRYTADKPQPKVQ